MAIAAPTLPYFCDPELLPGPLPTQEEILSSTHVVPTNGPEDWARAVIVRDTFFVKYGQKWAVHENEGHALLLLHRHFPPPNALPVPRLYAMYRDEKSDRLFIVMERMPGDSLQSVWESMKEIDKLDITAQLRELFTRIRQGIPSPGVFGSVTGGPLGHRFFWAPRPDPVVNGPFREERDFNRAMAISSRRRWGDDGQRPWASEFLERHLPDALVGHEIVFTHGDIQRKNILVAKRDGQPPEGSEDKGGENLKGRWEVTAIVDWEEAGFYPSYWEYAAMFMYLQWVDDWPEKYERIIDPCPLEAGMMLFVRQILDY
ncbi:hypothetical protein VTJ49DRAFT_7295 [Mycothermus thermophilus]|uniref:Aminoglycoside phosphotransferase domain-containing protein n=1 Tax=Humicola insolens TaxID=85995 RepID=A0ABR3VHD5_HUMIN